MKKILLLLSIAGYTIASQDINEIKFQGLTQISNEIALETLHLKDNSKYTLPEINKAIKKFYNFNYFNNIWTTDIDNTLTFHFTEKPFIAKLTMTGYKNRDEELESLYMSMGIKKGTMYTPKKLKKAKKALLIALEREGYINSTVDIDVETINDTSVALTFEVNKGSEIIVTNVSYKGVKALDIGDIEDVIANKETDCCFTWFFGQNDGEMDFEQLEYDSLRIRDLYLQNGYLDAKVTPAFSKIDFNTNTASIEYTIDEGNQYTVNDIIIYLDEEIEKVDTLYPELKLEKDDIFNITKLRKDQTFIKTAIANKGYAYTQVNYDIKPNKENHTVDIVYNAIPGDKVYIQDVVISGNSRTLDRVIRRNVYLAPTDLYNLTDLKD
ncbi:MAG: POTRA domain-containing protein [Campylobacterota bacterium]|nr:POTRA domain-containing protein [Campylobacterota bacterium]